MIEKEMVYKSEAVASSSRAGRKNIIAPFHNGLIPSSQNILSDSTVEEAVSSPSYICLLCPWYSSRS